MSFVSKVAELPHILLLEVESHFRMNTRKLEKLIQQGENEKVDFKLEYTKGAGAEIARDVSGSAMLEALAGLAAVVGHNYSIFLGGRGGAGVMITMAMLYVLSPLTLAIAAPFGLLAMILSRWASLGSLTATGLMAVTLTVLVILGRELNAKSGPVPGDVH